MAYNTQYIQTHTGLTVRYNYDGKPFITKDESKVLYKITRVITKSYSIVGIPSYEDAKTVADAKIQHYTQSKKGWYIVDTGQGINVDYFNMTYPVAEVSPTHTSGCMWQVDINVNQKDEVWSFTTPSGSLASYFPPIVPSYYDEPTNS